MLSVIIPASNEAGWIGRCLAAIAASDPVEGGLEVIVVANGCRDQTAEIARGFSGRVPLLQVIELERGSKPLALNAGDAAAKGEKRAWLDADCVVSPAVMTQLSRALERTSPVYAGATPVVPRPKSLVTRAYARFWQNLPFARSVAPGFGLYAVNAAGRARWGAFPSIISDDTFVRLQFDPGERVQVAARYDWPMIEGFAALARVRRRQDRGVAELQEQFPGIFAREGKARMSLQQLAGMALQDPVGFAVYAAVSLTVRLRPGDSSFARGR
jgi:glycosyltransferase involved in cell wall biosynthesis